MTDALGFEIVIGNLYGYSRKDKTLENNGYKVYRIKWRDLNNEINKFLEYYQSVGQ